MSSPITPYFFNWAFNRHRGAAIKPHWDLIPDDTDVLITHGSIFRILDTTESGQHVGCKDLMQKVTELNLKVHCCGHIHEAYGSMQRLNTTFVNASVLDINYKLVNAPIVLDI